MRSACDVIATFCNSPVTTICGAIVSLWNR